MSELLTKSHNSLKSLYECSHRNLDELVNISKAFGVGARLTGAGMLKSSVSKSQSHLFNFLCRLGWLHCGIN
jgi:hypothetical protein